MLSRIVFRLLGVEIEHLEIDRRWQIIDPSLLQNDLGRSLFYLHTQPPLFDAFLGVLVKVFPDPVMQARAYSLDYAALGMLLPFVLYGILRRVGVGRW